MVIVIIRIFMTRTMELATNRLSVLLLLMAVALVTVDGKGMKLNLDLEAFSITDGDDYNQVTCRGEGGDVTVDSLTIKRMRVTGAFGVTRLLAVSKNKRSGKVILNNIEGTATLENNIAQAELKILSSSTDEPDYFYICQATYRNGSGDVETTFAMVGPGVDKFPGQWMEKEKDSYYIDETVPEEGTKLSFAELELLSEKLAGLEGTVDRLEQRFASELSSYGKRLKTVETDGKLRILGSVESPLSQRLARLEEKIFAMADKSEGDHEPKISKEKIAEMKPQSDEGNKSQLKLLVKEQPTVCERGMGDDVTRDYQKYVLLHNKLINKTILCDTHTDGGGWIVFHRRAHGDVDFYRDWTSYRNGFGSPSGDFWLGNEAIYQLTDGEAYELRIDLRFNGKEMFAAYSSFRLEDQDKSYNLKLGPFTGTAVDAFSYHNNHPFTTFDRDHDGHGFVNCASIHHGGWWYHTCYKSNLNGKWGFKEPQGNVWDSKKGQDPVSFSEMKIRRVQGPVVG